VQVLSSVLTIVAFAFVAVGFGQPLNPDQFQKYKDDVAASPRSSLAHFRLGEAYQEQKNFQSAANEFREVLNGDLMPKWTEVWALINLGKIFDMTGQCSRAVNEYNLALRTDDDTFHAQVEVEDYLTAKIIRPFARVPDAPDDGGLPGGVHRPGTYVISPIVLAKTEPQYSEAARLAGLEGTVLLKAVIAEDGSAQQIRVTRPLGLGLDENAVEAVRTWLFTPGFSQAHPAPVEIDLAVDFFLQSRQSRWHMVGVAFHPPEGGFKRCELNDNTPAGTVVDGYRKVVSPTPFGEACRWDPVGRVSEPVFDHVDYPPGAGVARSAIDDARLVNAMRRFAAVRLTFEVDEGGVPVHFRVEHASEAVWGIEAIAVLQKWRFKPGERNGMPVSVPTTIDMIWGERNLTESPVKILEALTSPDSQVPPDEMCRSSTGRPRFYFGIDITSPGPPTPVPRP
jgi:TonB family protein